MKKDLKKLILTSLFITFGFILALPFRGLTIFGFQAGVIFSPMHLTVLIAGFILGEKYGLIVGFLTPLFASVVSGLPPLFPSALIMSLELGTYGFISGLLYKQRKQNIYLSLIVAMVLGRIIYLVGMGIVFLGGLIETYNFVDYLKTLFIISSPAIIIQVIFVPLLVKLIEKRLIHIINR